MTLLLLKTSPPDDLSRLMPLAARLLKNSRHIDGAEDVCQLRDVAVLEGPLHTNDQRNNQGRRPGAGLSAGLLLLSRALPCAVMCHRHCQFFSAAELH